MKLSVLCFAACAVVTSAKTSGKPMTAVFNKTRPDNNNHSGDPATGCLSDEVDTTITGVSGDVCTPACPDNCCPTDKPGGVTATPACALQDSAGDKYCVLECDPSTNQCGPRASCKLDPQGTGLCTYDDR